MTAQQIITEARRLAAHEPAGFDRYVDAVFQRVAAGLPHPEARTLAGSLNRAMSRRGFFRAPEVEYPEADDGPVGRIVEHDGVLVARLRSGALAHLTDSPVTGQIHVRYTDLAIGQFVVLCSPCGNGFCRVLRIVDNAAVVAA